MVFHSTWDSFDVIAAAGFIFIKQSLGWYSLIFELGQHDSMINILFEQLTRINQMIFAIEPDERALKHIFCEQSLLFKCASPNDLNISSMFEAAAIRFKNTNNSVFLHLPPRNKTVCRVSHSHLFRFCFQTSLLSSAAKWMAEVPLYALPPPITMLQPPSGSLCDPLLIFRLLKFPAPLFSGSLIGQKRRESTLNRESICSSPPSV